MSNEMIGLGILITLFAGTFGFVEWLTDSEYAAAWAAGVTLGAVAVGYAIGIPYLEIFDSKRKLAKLESETGHDIAAQATADDDH